MPNLLFSFLGHWAAKKEYKLMNGIDRYATVK